MNGTLQSGMAFDLKIANPTLDSQILTVTREAAAEVLTADPTLTQNGHEGLRELRKRYSGREEIDFFSNILTHSPRCDTPFSYT